MNNSTKNIISYRRDIEGLRAIAVISVLFFHAFPESLRGGFVGVDIFFVISGFLITKGILMRLKDDAFSLGEFYARRIRRIFPALILVLVACLAFGWIMFLAENLIELAKESVGGAGFVLNFILWHEVGYFDKASELKPLLHLWSLSIEEQFYIAWPLLLGFAWRRRFSLFALIFVVTALSFTVNVLGVTSHPTATFYSPISRAWELLLGAALAQYEASNKSAQAMRRCVARWFGFVEQQTGASVISVVGLGMIAIAVFYFDSSEAFPGWRALLPSLGSLMIIVAGPHGWVNRVLLARTPLVAIGLISYPLYLWHWPLLTFFRDHSANGGSPYMKLLLLAVSFILAWMTYEIVEKRFRQGGHSPRKVWLLSSLMFGVAFAGGVIWINAGFPSRYPEIIQKATAYNFEIWKTGIRYRKCFLEFDQDGSQFSSECVDKGKKGQLWLLWGDSGSASLYPGFRTLIDKVGTLRLAQFGSSACPPMLGYTSKERVYCKENNDIVFEKVKRLSPDVVVLSAMWGLYDSAQLVNTIAAIYQLGVRRVIVLGPTPHWKSLPSATVFSLWKQDPLHRTPSARLDYKQYGFNENLESRDGQDSRVSSADQRIRKLAQQSHAEYISLMDVLCNSAGCLMRSSEQRGDSFYLDASHLNRAGSEYVVQHIAGALNMPAHE